MVSINKQSILFSDCITRWDYEINCDKEGNDNFLKFINNLNNNFNMNIKQVIHNPPATIIYWNDNTKTVVKVQDDELYDKEKGLALCYMKKLNGNKGNFNKILKKWCKDE